MNAQQYQPGELVDVAIKGALVVTLVERVFATDLLRFRTGENEIELALIPGVTVTRVAPREWPPQPGDVWENADGAQWFTRGDDRGTTWLVPTQARRDARRSDEALAENGPLQLAFRRGWAPETSPAGRDTVAAPEASAVATTGQPRGDRAAKIQGLRELADWLEANPGVPFQDSGSCAITTWAWQVVGGYGNGDDAAQAEVLRRTAALIGADLVEGVHGGPHGLVVKEFTGRVRYELCHVVKTAADTDIAQVGEVAGPDGDAGPATTAGETAASAPDPALADGTSQAGAPLPGDVPAADPAPVVTGDGAAVAPEHYHAGGAAGGPGENAAQCACGTTYAGFDSHAEAVDALNQHIANPDPAADDEPED